MVETTSKSGSSTHTLSNDASFRPELDLPDVRERRLPGQRILVGTAFVLMGLAAIAAGSGSIVYRMTHLTTNNGLVNGRTVRVSAPTNGEITAFYAQIGAPVSKGQVLARLDPVNPLAHTDDGNRVQDTEVQQVQLAAAHQTLTLLIEQLATLKRYDATRQQATLAIAQDTIADQTALVVAAQAEAGAAQLEYQRYQQLLADGVVSRQRVSELEADWKAAEAMVAHAQANLSAAQTAHTATASGVPLDSGSMLQNQLALEQKIQAQRESIQVLERQLQSRQTQLTQAPAPEGSQAVVAPVAGIVHNTFVDTGEQVNRPTALLTVLDCQNRWVETLVSAEQASQMDRDRPVRVRLAGQSETVVGTIEVIEAVSRADLAKKQAQALIPAVPLHLDGQPLSRVIIRVPPAEAHTQVDQFCGVGQTAQITFAMRWPRF